MENRSAGTKVSSEFSGCIHLNFDLDVPRTLIYQLDISTNNGSIAVSNHMLVWSSWQLYQWFP